MPALGDFLAARAAELHRGDALKGQTRDLAVLGDQKRQRDLEQARAQATVRRAEVERQLSDPRTWKTLPKEKITELQAMHDSTSGVLGVPVREWEDARIGAVPQLIDKLMQNVAKGIGVGPDGEISDLALYDFEDIAGEDFMNRWFVNERNIGVTQGASEAEPNAELDGKTPTQAPKPDVSRETAIRNDWRTALKELAKHQVSKPLSPKDRMDNFGKKLAWLAKKVNA